MVLRIQYKIIFIDSFLFFSGCPSGIAFVNWVARSMSAKSTGQIKTTALVRKKKQTKNQTKTIIKQTTL